MYTIIGSGFGLYGYLPALVEGFDETVILPISYEYTVRTRPELFGMLGNIRWVKDEQVALSQVSAVVIATPPLRQYKAAIHCLTLPNIKKIILEKPIAVTPELASSLVDKIGTTNKRYRIGFTFLYTKWHHQLEHSKLLVSDGDLHITWKFMANHFAKQLSSWKRRSAEGGGVLRFFGIHLVAMLASKGYDKVKQSKIESNENEEQFWWQAMFTGSGLPNCYVFVDSFSTEKCFKISQNYLGSIKIIASSIEPFESERSNQGSDLRVGPLKKIIATFDENDEDFKQYYIKTINLWAATESLSSTYQE